jgi:hypothetical protein
MKTGSLAGMRTMAPASVRAMPRIMSAASDRATGAGLVVEANSRTVSGFQRVLFARDSIDSFLAALTDLNADVRPPAPPSAATLPFLP